MPLLVFPLLTGLTVGGGAGFFAGSFSNGWFKYLIILIILVFLFTNAKKLGVFK